VIKSSNTN